MRAAMSVSFKASVSISRSPARQRLRRRGNAAAVRSKKLARCSRRRRRATSWTRCSRSAARAQSRGAARSSGALPSVRHSATESPCRAPCIEKIVADQAKGKVVGDDVRAGDEEEHAGADKEQRVDDQPEAMLLEVLAQQRAKDRLRPCGVEVVGVEKRDGRLVAQVPEQALLGDAFGNPAHDPRLGARHPSLMFCGLGAAACRRSRSASASMVRNRSRSRRKNPFGASSTASSLSAGGLVRHFAIEARDGRAPSERDRRPLLKIR